MTGASSGIGAAFAHALAARGLHLLLTARPEDAAALDAVAAGVAATHGVRAVAVTADLAEADCADVLAAAAGEHDLAPDVLVNAAGLGSWGAFAGAPAEDQLRMLHVDVEALLRLTHRFAGPMAGRGQGAIVNLASTAAFQPQPHFAVYAASKAFVLRFGEALWAEQRGAGVRVVTVCPGAVTVPGEQRDEGPVREFLKRRYLTAEQVAVRALEAVDRGRPVVVLRMPVLGRAYHLRALVGAALPRHARLALAERLNRWYAERTG